MRTNCGGFLRAWFLLAVASLLWAMPAEAGFRKPRVLFLHSQSDPAYATDVSNKLIQSDMVSSADIFDARAATPTLAFLKLFDAVLISNQASWFNRDALGNVMADYVDAGGGVVLSVFADAGVPGSDLGGRWTGDYTVINFGSSFSGTNATLGTITQVNHPIMNGVQTFNGGTNSFRPNGTTLQAGATLIASWSDGKPLVAVGSRPNRADLGFWPPSSDVRGDLWVSSTDGVKLMVNALYYVTRPRIMFIHSVGSTYANDVVQKLRGTGQVGMVDAFDASAGTPTLFNLTTYYDAALVSNESVWANRDALGNVLADYVDAGGGVVVSIFTNGGVPGSNLGGRFTGDYEIVPFAQRTQGAATLGAVSYASHPIMAGVATFNGGSSAYRPNQTTVIPGGLIVAKWSDGKVLAAVSTKRPNRADLGFWPPSSDVQTGLWASNTDGAKLMANALVYTVKPYIGVAHSDFAGSAPNDVVAKLSASRRFSGVFLLPGLDGATPTLATLSQFNSIFSWSNLNFADANGVGNVLANYVDAGGGVVESVFSVTNNAGYQNSRPRGRWITEGYDITPEGSTGTGILSAATLGTTVGVYSPINRFVRKFDGGSASYRQGNDPDLRGRRVLNWSDGRMLASVHNFRKRVDLGFYPPSSVASNDQWNTRTDGTTLMANALEFASSHRPCPGDLNGDGVVDDSDFSKFVVEYNNLVDPRGDLNGDGLTDDADFSVFVVAYNAFECP